VSEYYRENKFIDYDNYEVLLHYVSDIIVSQYFIRLFIYNYVCMLDSVRVIDQVCRGSDCCCQLLNFDFK
jgi:hypothetical protein